VKREVIKSGKEIRFSTSLPSLDGTKEYFDGVYIPKYDLKGHSDGIIGYFRNVTETMRAQEALREATKKLHILNGITRHDILNQLVTLAGFLELHKRSLGEQASYPYLARVERSIEVIRKQVEFTGDYEAMGSSSPEWHSVAKLVRGVPQSNIERVEIGEMAEKLTILADPMLPKVFGNLLLNSLKHGGKVTKVMVDCRETEGGIILSYADDGVGIPMEEKERIFDKGFGKGTGLGLFFSKEVLGITGITIKENGEPGKGARFEMFVPLGSYALADSE
jgi:signal transduction histidine kinase